MRRQEIRQKAPAFIVAVALTALALAPAAPGHAAKQPQAGSQIQFGVDMAKRGLWNEALFRFQRALLDRPRDARILNNIAVSYEALGLFEEALEAYRKGLEASPSDRDLRNNYSRFLEFYQSFKPAEESSGEESPAEESSEEESPVQDGEGEATDG
jgi:Tfp pilus assembly protein PilF